MYVFLSFIPFGSKIQYYVGYDFEYKVSCAWCTMAMNDEMF